jgi:hypothetical protein
MVKNRLSKTYLAKDSMRGAIGTYYSYVRWHANRAEPRGNTVVMFNREEKIASDHAPRPEIFSKIYWRRDTQRGFATVAPPVEGARAAPVGGFSWFRAPSAAAPYVARCSVLG